jgi:uncharacterized membrane protein YgdD (TMEM256/DUF423 family)
MTTLLLRRIFIALTGILGLSGVALAAAASHLGDTRLLGSASTMALAHAPVLLVIALNFDRLKTAALSGLLIALGTLVFGGDLVLRHYLGHGLFPMSAPTGGVLMMAGWLSLSLNAFLKD